MKRGMWRVSAEEVFADNAEETKREEFAELTAERDRLRKALETVANTVVFTHEDGCNMKEIAQEALRGEEVKDVK